MIACKTTIGFGAPTKAGTASSHGSPLGAEEIKGAREKLGWTSAPFEVPADILSGWRAAGQRAKAARKAWDERLAALPMEQARRVRAPHQRRPAARGWPTRCASFKQKLADEPKEIATRKASENALEAADRRRCRRWSAARPT